MVVVIAKNEQSWLVSYEDKFNQSENSWFLLNRARSSSQDLFALEGRSLRLGVSGGPGRLHPLRVGTTGAMDS